MAKQKKTKEQLEGMIKYCMEHAHIKENINGVKCCYLFENDELLKCKWATEPIKVYYSNGDVHIMYVCTFTKEIYDKLKKTNEN